MVEAFGVLEKSTLEVVQWGAKDGRNRSHVARVALHHLDLALGLAGLGLGGGVEVAEMTRDWHATSPHRRHLSPCSRSAPVARSFS
jgi:hypothetical protein